MNAQVRIRESGTTETHDRSSATTHYVHQPGDMTRYEIVAVELRDGGLSFGNLGRVSRSPVLVICGRTGKAYLFEAGDDIAEWYIEEHFELTNPHDIHHFTELVAQAIGGRAIACDHGEVPA